MYDVMMHDREQNNGITDLSYLHACRSSTSQHISYWMESLATMCKVMQNYKSATLISSVSYSKCLIH